MTSQPKTPRPPTGPVRPRRLETGAVRISGAVGEEVPSLASGGEVSHSTGALPDAPPGSNADAPTRQIDTKHIVSAAFEQEEPDDDLGFDRPLFGGEDVDGPGPQGLASRHRIAAGSAAFGSRRTPSGGSVVVEMDFDTPEEDTPASLWARRGGLGPGADPRTDTTGASSRRPRPATGPHRPGQRSLRRSEEIALPALGSARKKDRPSTTGRLPRQTNSVARGGGRVAVYIVLGAVLGLGAAAFFGMISRSPDRVRAPKTAVLSAAGAVALESIAHRRALDDRERAMLVIVLRRVAERRWEGAHAAFVALPARLRRDVGVRCWLGQIQRGQGQVAMAIVTFQTLLARAPAASLRVELGVELGKTLLVTGRRAEALAAAQKAKRELDADASEALAGRVLRLLRHCKHVKAR
ncbi:MAG: hypothetical protein KAI47_00895 [Deltaproteobacteria bacterium]|nr:hypothetical protein [Deltaproteobacteria bacterium]